MQSAQWRNDMNKVMTKILNAIVERKSISICGRDRFIYQYKVVFDEVITLVYQWGEKVACVDYSIGSVYICNCGHKTRTTKQLLNTILAAREVMFVDATCYQIEQEKNKWYISCNGVRQSEWNGDWILL
jgi:hypothetical protein